MKLSDIKRDMSYFDIKEAIENGSTLKLNTFVQEAESPYIIVKDYNINEELYLKMDDTGIIIDITSDFNKAVDRDKLMKNLIKLEKEQKPKKKKLLSFLRWWK